MHCDGYGAMAMNWVGRIIIIGVEFFMLQVDWCCSRFRGGLIMSGSIYEIIIQRTNVGTYLKPVLIG